MLWTRSATCTNNYTYSRPTFTTPPTVHKPSSARLKSHLPRSCAKKHLCRATAPFPVMAQASVSTLLAMTLGSPTYIRSTPSHHQRLATSASSPNHTLPFPPSHPSPAHRAQESHAHNHHLDLAHSRSRKHDGNSVVATAVPALPFPVPNHPHHCHLSIKPNKAHHPMRPPFPLSPHHNPVQPPPQSPSPLRQFPLKQSSHLPLTPPQDQPGLRRRIHRTPSYHHHLHRD
jgi:hypothetical protein